MTTSTTRTGNITIGFRRGGGWQADFCGLLKWAGEAGFGAIDLGANSEEDLAKLIGAGFRCGSLDLTAGGWKELLSPDAATRAEAAKKASAWIEAGSKHGPQNFFAVMLPQEPQRARKENFDFMVDGYSKLVPALEKTGSHIVVEGWPGPAALCCTPETYRAFFKAIGSKSIGVNYDPSHLIRMGIDPIRFLNEFGDLVYHVHGKDTEVLADRVYEFGHEQPATFAPGAGFGAWAWRYTIPGHGVASWPEIFRILAARNYRGCVCVELEDCNFNGSEAGEKLGLRKSLEFLQGA